MRNFALFCIFHVLAGYNYKQFSNKNCYLRQSAKVERLKTIRELYKKDQTETSQTCLLNLDILNLICQTAYMILYLYSLITHHTSCFTSDPKRFLFWCYEGTAFPNKNASIVYSYPRSPYCGQNTPARIMLFCN